MSTAANVNPLAARRKIKTAVDDDPMSLADGYELSKRADAPASPRVLWYFRDEYYVWDAATAAYRVVPRKRIHNDLYRFLRNRRLTGVDGARVCKPDQKLIGRVIDALDSVCELYADEIPCWVNDEGLALRRGNADRPAADDVLAFKNGLLDLGRYLSDADPRLLPPTPAWFATQAFPYDFAPGSDCPQWKAFLAQAFPDAPGRIELLQEWFGYCLTRDVGHHKMMLMVGPKRSGKGTIGRILEMMVGSVNVAGPTVATLASQFGLQPLVDASVAIVSDARFRGPGMDVVGERLLSISGEGTVTVERKFLPSITLKLGTRFVFMTNEMPRITDASGALASRFLILQFTESFYGREDITLTDRLATELNGVVLWAIEGLARLREQGRFTQLPEQILLVEQMEELASPVSAFLRDECILPHQALDAGIRPEDLNSPVESVWGRWQWWAKHNGHSEGSKIDLGRKLSAILPKFKKVRPGGADERSYVYQGFKLRDRTPEEEYATHGGHAANQSRNGEFDFD